MESNPTTVLVIDRDAASRKYLADRLEKSGHSVLTAPSGKEGLILAWQQIPDAIIIDPALPDIKAVDLITRLRQDRRTSKVPCIALSGSNDPGEANRLLSAGFTEYLVKSSQALEDIQTRIPKLLSPDMEVKKSGKLIVLLSAKGGTGTSSLCANLAMCTGKATSTLRVAVIDLILPIGSIASIVGYRERLNIVSVSSLKPEELTSKYFKEQLPKMPAWYFQLLAGSPDPDSANELSVDRLNGMVAAILEAYDYVFVDLGRSLSRISLPIIQKADLLGIVLSTDSSSVSITRTILEHLKNQKVDSRRIYPIMNRVIGLEGMTKAEAEKIIGMQIRAVMPYMGGNFGVANAQHEPVATKFPNDSATLVLQETARQMADVIEHLHIR